MSNENPTERAGLMRSRAVLLGLVALFAGPIVIAWMMSAGYLNVGDEMRTNRGVLLNPPIDLREAPNAAALFDKANLQPGEWALVQVVNQACDKGCVATMSRLLTIRSVLGYAGQRVRILTVSPQNDYSPIEDAVAGRILVNPELTELLFNSLNERGVTLDTGQILLLDWRRQVAESFARDAPSIDIKKDLKKLLRASRIR